MIKTTWFCVGLLMFVIQVRQCSGDLINRKFMFIVYYFVL